MIYLKKKEVIDKTEFLLGILYLGLFGLPYFRAYIKQLMQINKFLCIIY